MKLNAVVLNYPLPLCPHLLSVSETRTSKTTLPSHHFEWTEWPFPDATGHSKPVIKVDKDPQALPVREELGRSVRA